MNEPTGKQFSAVVNRLLRRAIIESESVNANEVTVQHLLVAMLQEASIQALLAQQNLSVDDLRKQYPANG